MNRNVARILNSRGYQRGDMLRDSHKGVVVFLYASSGNIYCSDLEENPIIYDKYGKSGENTLQPIEGDWSKYKD